jgi:hypothetical protein
MELCDLFDAGSTVRPTQHLRDWRSWREWSRLFPFLQHAVYLQPGRRKERPLGGVLKDYSMLGTDLGQPLRRGQLS